VTREHLPSSTCDACGHMGDGGRADTALRSDWPAIRSRSGTRLLATSATYRMAHLSVSRNIIPLCLWQNSSSKLKTFHHVVSRTEILYVVWSKLIFGDEELFKKKYLEMKQRLKIYFSFLMWLWILSLQKKMPLQPFLLPVVWIWIFLSYTFPNHFSFFFPWIFLLVRSC